MAIMDEKPYLEQINKVQDYIENHLEEQLTVSQLSQIANFSAYHFQRLFAYSTGETLYGFVKRLRLERAAYLLLTDRQRAVTDIAMRVGFSNQAAFAKAFKARYGISSSCYRKTTRTNEKLVTSNEQTFDEDKTIAPLHIEIRYEQAIQLIYIRYTGAYKGDSNLFRHMFNKLYRWAEQRQLITFATRWFVIYHDFGSETDDAYLRFSVCMSVKGNVAVSGDVGLLTLSNGLYSVGSFIVGANEYERAWQYMYTQWLPSSAYQLDDRFSLEHYPPRQQQKDKQRVEIYIPVKR